MAKKKVTPQRSIGDECTGKAGGARQRRRRFLTTALSAVAGPQILATSALGKGNQAAPSERIAIGCIGMGNRGPMLMRSRSAKISMKTRKVAPKKAPAQTIGSQVKKGGKR